MIELRHTQHPRVRRAKAAAAAGAFLPAVMILVVGLQVQVGTSQILDEAKGRKIVNDKYSSSPRLRSLKGTEDTNKAPRITTRISRSNRVDFMYTFGAPSTAKNPHVSNPGNKCSKLKVWVLVTI